MYSNLQKILGSLKKNLFPIFTILLVCVIFFFHFYKITEIPSDLYLDETSIGINAHYISRYLTDEYGEKLPIYFKAFGEYKNPIYIYTTAIVYRMLDTNNYIFGLRFTSFIFWVIFFIGMYRLSCLISESKLVRYLSLLIAAFSPFIFQISRISFEVISQASFQIWIYYFLFRFHSDKKKKWFYIAITLLAFSYYSYSTSRLYVLMAFPLILLYAFIERIGKKTILIAIISAILIIAPAFIASANNSAITERFGEITYIFNQDMSIPEKIIHFVLKYGSNFNPIFLLVSGDSNPRHSTIFGGEIFLVSLVGIVLFIIKFQKKNIFGWLLIGLLLLSPIPTSIVGGSYHGLRSLIIFLSMVPISLLGLNFYREKKVMLLIISIFTSIQVVMYLYNYFSPFGYSEKYFDANKNYGFNNIVYKLQELNPQNIYLFTEVADVHKKFYELILDRSFLTDFDSTLLSRSCLITNASDTKYDNLKLYLDQDNSKYKLRCNF